MEKVDINPNIKQDFIGNDGIGIQELNKKLKLEYPWARVKINVKNKQIEIKTATGRNLRALKMMKNLVIERIKNLETKKDISLVDIKVKDKTGLGKWENKLEVKKDIVVKVKHNDNNELVLLDKAYFENIAKINLNSEPKIRIIDGWEEIVYYGESGYGSSDFK